MHAAMNSFLLALLIVGLLYGIPASIRTLRSQMDDPRAVLLLLIGAVVIVCGVWR
jgi:hypothetical protein